MFKVVLLALSLSLSPIFWMPYIGKVYALKTILYFLTALIFLGSITHAKRKYFLCFFVSTVFCFFATLLYDSTLRELYINLYSNIIMSLIFFTIGATYKDSITDVLKYTSIFVGLYMFFLFCLIMTRSSISLGNYIDDPTIYFSELSLQSSGWGFGRTQWSTCLSLFCPICLFSFLDNHEKKYLFFLSLILASQIASTGRGGLVASVLSLVFILYKKSKNKIYAINLSLLLLFICAIIVSYYSAFFRITDGANFNAITTNRYGQWEAIIPLFTQMPLWGYGQFGNSGSLSQFIDYQFHDSFLRILFAYGLAGIVVISFVLTFVFQILFSPLQESKVKISSCLQGVIIAGIVCSFFEPNPIFQSFYWTPWWFVAGYYLNHCMPDNTLEKNEIFDTVLHSCE